MKYIAYQGTPYQKRVTIPERKSFGLGPKYSLNDVFPNYGNYTGHRTAKGLATQLREQGYDARVDPHSGYTAVYARKSRR